MAITRAQMRRQLRRNGGITNAVPRQNYGLGSKIKDRFRKLIPNELADIAVKAAPFVAPFNPGIAGLMRGIGRFDQRGSISDALKQGLLTTGLGAGARYLGGADQIMGGGLRGGFTSPLSTGRTQSFRNLFKGKDVSKVKSVDQGEKGIGIVKKGVEAIRGKFPILKELPPMVQQQLLVGGITAGASALYSLLVGDFREKLPEETMEEFLEARRKSVGSQMRIYMDNYFTFDPNYSELDEAGKDAFVARYNKNQGGRVGLANGSPHFDPPTFSEGVGQMYMSDDLGALPKAGGGVRSEDMGILSVDDFDNLEDYRRYINKLPFEMARTEEPNNPRLSENDIMRQINNLAYMLAKKEEPDNPRLSEGDIIRQINRLKNLLGNIKGNVTNDSVGSVGIGRLSEGDITRMLNRLTNTKAQGGRIKKYGGGIGTAMPRISMGIPRVNAGGIRELDYRATGGFVPVGIKEKKDDVPAMLSKNEFVMTADAVKGAGGGNVEKGAQKMYNTMKRLEGRVA